MFKTRLNQIRKSKSITAQQMADYLGIHIRAYRKYESGDTTPPIENLVKIADYLDVSTDFLLCRDDFLHSHGVFFD